MAEGPRIRVRGGSGGGKTTAARAIAEALDVPMLELDNVYWHQTQPMYERYRTDDDARALLRQFLDRHDAWVIEGNYSGWSHEANAQATEVILIELPRPLRVWRLLRRWWVGRRGLRGGDDATLRSFLELLHFTVWTSRNGPARRLESMRESGVPWVLLQTSDHLLDFLDRFPGARARFESDVRRNRTEAEAVIAERRDAEPDL